MNFPTSSAKPLAMRNLLMSLAMLSLISAHHVRATVPAAHTTEQIEQTMAQGERAFQHGDLEQAANNWYEAAASYEAQGVRARQVDALILAAEAYQALGQYPAALRILYSARNVAREVDDKSQMAAIEGSLGKAYLLTGIWEQARQHFEASITFARTSDNIRVMLASLNNLAQLLSRQGQPDQARIVYRQSTTLAKRAGAENSSVNLEYAKALTGLAKLALRDRHNSRAGLLLTEALAQVRMLPPSRHKMFGLITLGRLFLTLHTQAHFVAADISARWGSSAYHALAGAADAAKRLGEMRAVAYARGYLGQLYAHEQRLQEALYLTRQAVFAAQQIDAAEILYRWQWQAARLLKAQGNIDAAISAYRQAVYSLQAVRRALTVGYAQHRLSFRDTTQPLFFELADLLLTRAKKATDPQRTQAYLLEARKTMEQVKAAELQDYFQDACVADLQSRTTGFDRLSSHTIAIYPILLADRTELLLSLPAGMRQITISVGRHALTQEIRQFRSLLEKRTTREYLPHAQRLYRWLIQPIEATLDAHKAHTLVFVPGGALRTIPMAALHDGERFLIEKYALATTPGLTLTDPEPIEREHAQVLIGGLTQSVQGFPALEYVSSELRSIDRIYPGTLFKNEQFRISNVEQALSEASYSIVHIASHGQFASDADDSFLLTFDDKLTMDRLEQFMGLGRYRLDPVELLTLSACQTGTGNDRAALGLAGVAVKAGARSALATLWLVNDEAASLLMSEFYRRLQRTENSKAEALQQAQVWLQSDLRYAHPGYWSAFLIIGNWL